MGLITRLFSSSQTGAASVPLLPTQMTDTQATRLGLKQYTNGVNYNSGIAATITSAASGFSLIYQKLIPRQMQDGSWRISVYVRFDTNSANALAVTVPGTTFITGSALVQTGHGAGLSQGGMCSVTTTQNTGNINIRMRVRDDNTINSGVETVWALSGEFEIQSKPTWAY